MKNNDSVLEKHLNDDRWIILIGIGIVTLVAWIHLAGMSDNLSTHFTTVKAIPWQIGHLISYFTMWLIMMIAMMLPTAAPMILIFASISRKRQLQQQSYVNTSVFVIGYLVVSVGYSISITLFQWWLHNNALVTPLGVSASHLLSGLLLVGAGLYQWSALKYACLRLCRNPFYFLMTTWREGISGALRMGVKHGLFCTGCCWTLMTLMFVGGVMNLLWMIVITLTVLIEKIAPKGDTLAKIVGVIMVAAGFYFICLNFVNG